MTAQRPVEIELKYLVASEVAAERLLGADRIGTFAVDGPIRTVEFEDLGKRVAGQLLSRGIHVDALLAVIHQEDRIGRIVEHRLETPVGAGEALVPDRIAAQVHPAQLMFTLPREPPAIRSSLTTGVGRLPPGRSPRHGNAILPRLPV